MKRLFCIIWMMAMLLTCCACAKASVPDGEAVELRFIHQDKNINAVLSAEEAERVIGILNGKSYDPAFSGVPSCGFDKNISLIVGEQIFAIACDSCKYIQDLGTLRYFSVTQEEIQYLHSLFEKYGGYFPCI